MRFHNFCVRPIRNFPEMINPQSQLLGFDFSCYPGEVGFGDFAARKLVTEQASSTFSHCNQKHTADRTIEPVRESQIIRAVCQLPAEDGFEALNPGCSLCRDSSRFVHHKSRFSVPKDLDVVILRTHH